MTHEIPMTQAVSWPLSHNLVQLLLQEILYEYASSGAKVRFFFHISKKNCTFAADYAKNFISHIIFIALPHHDGANA